MIRLALAVVMMFAGPASAQVVSLPVIGPAIDQQARDAAAAAQAAAATACQPSAIVPPMETVGGSAGSGDACRLANAVQPRISRTVSGTTTSGGTGVVTWPAMPSVPKLTVTPYVASGASQAPVCVPVAGSVTTTGATIRCWTTQSVTVSILGAVVAPLTTAAAGVQFDVLALPGS